MFVVPTTTGFMVDTISGTGTVIAFHAQIIGAVILNALGRLNNCLADSPFRFNYELSP